MSPDDPFYIKTHFLYSMQLQNSSLIKATYLLLFIILLVYGLIAAKTFLVPLLLGILLAFLLYPIASALEKKGIPRIIANIITIIFGIAVVAGAVYFIYSQASNFAENLPQLKEQAVKNLKNLEKSIADSFGISVEQQDEWLNNQVSQAFTSSQEFFTQAFSATASTIAQIGLMPIYVFFLLYYRNKFVEFLLRLTPEEKHGTTKKIVDEISTVTKRYMGGITIVVLILCVLNTVGLLIVGVQYALMLGVISALMNYMPYFGTLLGGSFVLIITLLTEGSGNKILGVIILFIIIQFTENNILTPNIVGGNVRINPFFTILTLIIGGLLWGVAGMFIILPFMAMFRILSENIDSLNPYAFLLSTKGTEEHALTGDKIKRFFKIKRK